jgi:hypothetical protein
VYDTLSGSQARNPKEHRSLLANIAKRSRFVLVYPGLIDRPDIRGNQIEMGNRYFEGAAAGAIMIGEPPQNDQYVKEFDWEDAVVRLPFGSDKIDVVLKDLDAQPQRQREVRKKNVRESLLRHDWAYRWEAVLRTAGLEPMDKLRERKKRLESISRMVGAE